MKNTPRPFDCEYSPQFAELLNKLEISIAVSTYQAGKVIILSAVNGDKLMQLPRTFHSPMGLATKKDTLAVATNNTVELLRNVPTLSKTYPQNPNVYDAIYMPRASYYTGAVSMHDMIFTPDDKIIGINTLFSCLCSIDNKYSFQPIWKPDFITNLAPEDKCHLNGLASQNGEVKYVTALGKSNEQGGWRENKMNGGIVMEYPSGRIIAQGLGMPHSPRIYNNKLYILNSTQGELICMDTQTGEYEVICKLGGFARGMSRCGDYLFIGVSKLRHNSHVFKDLPIAKTSFAGVVAVYLPYKTIVGTVKYEMTVDEIYDVKVLHNLKRPSLISPHMPIHSSALSMPTQAIWGRIQKKDKQ